MTVLDEDEVANCKEAFESLDADGRVLTKPILGRPSPLSLLHLMLQPWEVLSVVFELA